MTLSTPTLWVIVPLVVALICLVFSGRRVLGILLTTICTFGLALLATFFPPDLILNIGPLSLVFEETLVILGRQITLVYDFFPFIALIYSLTGIWALSSSLPGVPMTFRPISLAVVALLTAALGVQPFLYAAVLIQMAVLVSIPMLNISEKDSHRGILRYLTFMTIAMPFILIAGWLLTGVGILPPDSPLVGQTQAVLGLGFVIWLAVFPFHSWVVMISEHNHPTVISFLLFLLPTTILIFGLNFFNSYAFLRTSEEIFTILQVVGTVMIVFGGIWTAVQDHLKRAFGYSTLVETGFSLLAIGLMAQGGLNWLLLLLPARALGYWLWQYSLSRLEDHCGSLELTNLAGFSRKYPFISVGLILAQFSIAGLPLFASFPIKIVLLTRIFAQSVGLGIWVFIGSLGLFVFTIRVLMSLTMPYQSPSQVPEENISTFVISESRSEFLPVVLMVLFLVVVGLFPNTMLSGITRILIVFSQLP